MDHPAADQTPEQRMTAGRRSGQLAGGDTRYPRPIGEPPAPGQLGGDLDAAQRSAEAIRAAAEERARLRLDQAQQQADRLTAERVRTLARISDDLIEQAAAVRRRSEELLAALDRAIAAAAPPHGETEPGRAGAGPRPLPGEPATPPRGARDPDAPTPPSSALRRATELAMGGRARAEIAAVLRDEHDVEPGPLLDRVFGTSR